MRHFTPITLDPTRWQAVGPAHDLTGRLHYRDRLVINGQDFHTEAIAVHDDAALVQVAVAANNGEDLDALQTFAGGRLSTQTIDGRDYVVVITPFCD